METKKYVIKNCPACREYDAFSRDTEACCYNWHKYCNEVDSKDCVLKQIVDDVSTVYRTPEYFEKLEEEAEEEQYLIESAWHNVAHMVMSKLDIEEVE